MPRSSKKFPFVNASVLKKVLAGKKEIKTWSRDTAILPEFVGVLFHVHNGKSFIPVTINENMILHKLGEFALTKKSAKHAIKKVDNKSNKTNKKS